MTRVRVASLFLAGAGVAVVPWTVWLTDSLPCRYVSQHWGIAWGGFDSALAMSLAVTGVAALRRAAWLDRAAVATATLLAADAWFDVITSRGAFAVGFATAEALAIEIPVALLCLWVARSVPTVNRREALQSTGSLRSSSCSDSRWARSRRGGVRRRPNSRSDERSVCR